MPAKRISIRLIAILAFLTLVLMFTSRPAAAQQEQILHSFGSGPDGFNPLGSLVSDASGNLYGTTQGGGGGGVGMVFELTHTASGWVEHVLHTFQFNGKDGFSPYANLIFDSAGNLYGTTGFGGVFDDGTVFELQPDGTGHWTETVLHSFTGNDGQFPQAGLVFDGKGRLYGTTSHGGSTSSSGACSSGASLKGCGTVFQLKPRPGGGWAEKVLHNFDFNGTDGYDPTTGVIFDSAGNLYGTTQQGGANSGGTVFKLTPAAGGTWTEALLHSFNNNGVDGFDPAGGLIFDSVGNLYGTTASGGGTTDEGTVFRLTPATGGSWTETILYEFMNNGSDGVIPLGSLIFGSDGDLYGTTQNGGSQGLGTAFKLTPTASGLWTETQLHTFGMNQDAQGPNGGLIFDAAGNLYGTGQGGGTFSSGAVFEITP